MDFSAAGLDLRCDAHHFPRNVFFSSSHQSLLHSDVVVRNVVDIVAI